MAELPIMPVATDAILADTSHMSAEEFGAYCRLLFVMWRHGGMLNDNDQELANISGVPLQRWRRMKDCVMRPMTVIDGKVSQKRLTDTRLRVNEKRQKNAMSGGIGGTSRWGSTDHRALRSERLSAARQKGRHSKAEWQKLLDICGHACVKCGRGDEPMVKDHIQPIYRDGSDAIDNIQPLCAPCNSGKGPDETDYRPVGWRDAMRMPSERLAQFLKTPSSTPSSKIKTTDTPHSGTKSERAEPSEDDSRGEIATPPHQVGKAALEAIYAAKKPH